MKIFLKLSESGFKVSHLVYKLYNVGGLNKLFKHFFIPAPVMEGELKLFKNASYQNQGDLRTAYNAGQLPIMSDAKLVFKWSSMSKMTRKI